MANLSDPKKVAHNTAAELTIPKPGALTESEQLLEHSKLVREFMEMLGAAEVPRNLVSQPNLRERYPEFHLQAVNAKLQKLPNYKRLFLHKLAFHNFVFDYICAERPRRSALHALREQTCNEDKWEGFQSDLLQAPDCIRKLFIDEPLLGAIVLMAKRKSPEFDRTIQLADEAAKSIEAVIVSIANKLECHDLEPSPKDFLRAFSQDVTLPIFEALYTASLFAFVDDPKPSLVLDNLIHLTGKRYTPKQAEEAGATFRKKRDHVNWALPSNVTIEKFNRDFSEQIAERRILVTARLAPQDLSDFMERYADWWAEIKEDITKQPFKRESQQKYQQVTDKELDDECCITSENGSTTLLIRPKSDLAGKKQARIKLSNTEERGFNIRVDVEENGVTLDFGSVESSEEIERITPNYNNKPPSLSSTIVSLATLGLHFGFRLRAPIGHHIKLHTSELFSSDQPLTFGKKQRKAFSAIAKAIAKAVTKQTSA